VMSRIEMEGKVMYYTTGEDVPRKVNLNLQTQGDQSQPTYFRVVSDGYGKLQVQLLFLAAKFCSNVAWQKGSYSSR